MKLAWPATGTRSGTRRLVCPAQDTPFLYLTHECQQHAVTAVHIYEAGIDDTERYPTQTFLNVSVTAGSALLLPRPQARAESPPTHHTACPPQRVHRDGLEGRGNPLVPRHGAPRLRGRPPAAAGQGARALITWPATLAPPGAGGRASTHRSCVCVPVPLSPRRSQIISSGQGHVEAVACQGALLAACVGSDVQVRLADHTQPGRVTWRTACAPRRVLGTLRPHQVWDVSSGDCAFVLSDHTAPVTAAAFSPFDQHVLASASEDRSFKVLCT